MEAKNMYYSWTVTDSRVKSFGVDNALARYSDVALCLSIRIIWIRIGKKVNIDMRSKSGRKKLQILYSGVKALWLLKYCFDWKVEDNRQKKQARQILLGSAQAIRCNLGAVMFYALFKYTIHQRHCIPIDKGCV